MNHSDDHYRELADRLRRGTATEVPTAGLAAVRSRGRLRRQRHRVAAGAACVVVVAGGAVTVQRLAHVDGTPTIGDANPTTSTGDTTAVPPSSAQVSTTIVDQPVVAPGSTAQVQRVDPQYVWNIVRPGSAEAASNNWIPNGLSSGDAPYLLFSTAPGADPTGENYQPTLYRSDDGIHWTPSGSDGLTQPNMTRRGLATLDGTMLAFGTAAATAPIPEGGAGDAVLQVSTDNGASWSPVVLPVDLRSLAATPGVRHVAMNGGVAAYGDTAVVVVEIEPVWDAEVSQPLTITPNGVVTTEYPVAPADTTPIDSDLLPLSQFGIDPATVAARQTPRAFVSTDGAEFTEVTFPTLPDDVIPDGVAMRVVGNASGFYAIMNGRTTDGVWSKYVFQSADGAAWTALATTAYDVLGVLPSGTLVAQTWLGTNASGFALSSDGVTWQAYDFGALADPADGSVVSVNAQLTINDAGITAFAMITNDPIAERGGNSIAKDGVRVTVANSDGIFVATDDATGATLTIERHDLDGGLTVFDGDGSVITSFTADEVEPLTRPGAGITIHQALLHSTDGIHWSREDLKELTGVGALNAGFVHEADGKLLVTVVDPATRVGDDVAETLVLVGTPKR